MGHVWLFHDDTDKILTIRIEDSGGLLTVRRPDRKPVQLTTFPSRLLRHFLDNPGGRFTEQDLRDLLWPGDNNTGDVNAYLTPVRKALNGPSGRFLKKQADHFQLLNGPQDLLERPLTEMGRSDLLRLTTLDDLTRWDAVGRDNIHRFLDPLHAKVSFVGRLKEAAQLMDWLGGEEKVSFQILAGPGGRGKTRLAVHLLELLEKRHQGRWHAGFLEGEDNCENTLTHERFWRWRGRETLVIIDDASRWTGALARNVVPAVLHPPETSLRFLLIDSGVEDNYEWYNDLVGAAKTETHLFPRPLHLAPLDGFGDLDFSGDAPFSSRPFRRLMSVTVEAHLYASSLCGVGNGLGIVDG